MSVASILTPMAIVPSNSDLASTPNFVTVRHLIKMSLVSEQFQFQLNGCCINC